MTTQQTLRNRLHSVDNIMHITQAMEVVSGVRFRKLMSKMEHFRHYANKLSEIIARLKLAADTSHHPLFQSRPRQRIGLIIVAGDKGLCGSYNDRILKGAEKFIKTLESEQVDLYLFGNKAIDYFKKKPWNIKQKFSDLSRNLLESNVKEWSEQFISSFENSDYDELWIAFTHFKTILSNEIRIEKILPLENEREESPVNSVRIDYIFEPNPEKIYYSIIPYFFYAKIQSILYESYASELSSRIISMKAATKNAEDMIEKLTLIKNKNRQLAITKEILEITAGAEGLK